VTSPTNYPPLSSLLTVGELPANLDFLDVAVDDVLHGFRYSELVIETSPANDAKYFGLKVVVDELAIDLLGSGLRLVFFPAEPIDAGAVSEIPVSFSYRWPIRRYVREFTTAGFAHTARAFFDLVLQLADLTENELVEGLVDAIIDDPAPFDVLYDKLKAWTTGGSTPLSGLAIADVPLYLTEIGYLVTQAQAAGVDIMDAAFDAVVNNLDPDKALDNVITLASRWLGGIDHSDLERMLLPEFALELANISMAIEFPRSVLVPLDVDGKPKDAPATTRLTFTAAGVRYDSRSGFEIEILDSGLGVEFPRSIVPGFGLTLEFLDVKIDLSRTSNIAEATAEGRPVDFVGVFIGSAVVGLPEKWFAAYQTVNGPPVTLGIVGRNLLIGTGGFSGTIGLEALVAGKPKPDKTAPQSTEQLTFVLGKKPDDAGDRKGFMLGFSSFDMKFQQNQLLESRLKGSMTIPTFSSTPIDIELFIGNDGDFEVTASMAGGYLLTVPDIFTFNIESLSVGKDDRGVFLRTAGDISFANNNILKNLLKQPIHLSKLLIHSDGSIELEGGTIPLPESAVLKIGPAKIAITAVHLGAHEQEHNGILRKYRYVGFDGGVSVNPGGVDARGDGIKLYYTVDNDAAQGRHLHTFLRIDGIGVDLVIPGSASKEQAVLLLQGYLALKNPVYQGSLKFQLPQVGIAGGATMQYDTRHPAWAVDVNLELPTPIVLGSTSLGLYGFRGLFGLRYVASKSAIVSPTPGAPLPEGASWGDYYRAKQPEKGVSVFKFMTPDLTKGSRNPFSVGVGATLGTLDGGKVFSAQLLLLVSLPNLIMLEGRGDVLAKKRVGLTDDDPPYYAYLALSPESIELGVGVNYLVPKDTGAVLNLNVVLEAAFFFHNSSAWYVHFGTKAKPATARIISMFDGYAYLSISASGIETGAGVHFDFNKRYGPVGVDAHAYLDFWAYIAFERFQAGGGVALGGTVDVSMFKISLHIGLAATLTVEVPKPFRVAGSVTVCVSAKFLRKKITKCATLEFVWEKSKEVEQTPVPVLTVSTPTVPAAVAVHMVSGSTYPVAFSKDPGPLPAQSLAPIPLDAFVDVKFTKPVDPSAVAGRLGGYTSPAAGAKEILPPKFGSRRVRHSYSLTDVKLEVLRDAGWEAYHPYAALAPGALLSPDVLAQLESMPLGVWQKKDPGYSQIRFLALTPFSWMNPAGGYRPEEMGITAQSTYCVAPPREDRCVVWDVPAAYASGTDYLRDGVLHRVDGDRMAAVALGHPRLRPVSLAIGPAGKASFQFLEPVVRCRLNLVTTAPAVRVRWQRRKSMIGTTGAEVEVPYVAPEFVDAVPPQLVTRSDLANPVVYDDPAQPIERIVLETPVPDTAALARLAELIERRNDDWIRFPRERPAIAADIARLQEQLRAEHDKTCAPHRPGTGVNTEEIARLSRELAQVGAGLEQLRARFRQLCDPRGDGPRVPGTVEQCRALADAIAKLEEQARVLAHRIADLQRPGDEFPPEWQCGTFVHEICWLSAADDDYNRTIPDIETIEADFSAMRAAIEGTIAPIWRPGETYRVTLKVADHVQGPTVDAHFEERFYVHFRTEGPLGHFINIPAAGMLPAGPADLDDGRPEVPERALKFYIDMKRSVPDPSGNLLYAKPTYYRDVVLRLFFDKPHAYHFFVDWLVGDRSYALELAVKDPAEAAFALAPPAHEGAITESPTMAEQAWVVDDKPKIPEELKALRGFQNPQAGAGESAVCLTVGGAPITPLSKTLEADAGDLLPGKLYTAVVLNRRTSPPQVGETHSYGFKTSQYPDFASHIASCRLADGSGNARAAVFSVEDGLTNGDESDTVTAALQILAAPSTDTEAYPDPFDRLLYGLLQLDVLPPPLSLEFNFVVARTTGHAYAIWVRSPEPVYDPRLPDATARNAIRLCMNEVIVPSVVLWSRDRSQAFVLVPEGELPTAAVSFEFVDVSWNGTVDERPTVRTESFAKA